VLLFPLLSFPRTLCVTHSMFLAPAEDESVGTYTVHVTPKGDQVSARGGRALGGAHGKMGRGRNQLFVAGNILCGKMGAVPPPKEFEAVGGFRGPSAARRTHLTPCPGWAVRLFRSSQRKGGRETVRLIFGVQGLLLPPWHRFRHASFPPSFLPALPPALPPGLPQRAGFVPRQVQLPATDERGDHHAFLHLRPGSAGGQQQDRPPEREQSPIVRL
jgi:hypothetical protein